MNTIVSERDKGQLKSPSYRATSNEELEQTQERKAETPTLASQNNRRIRGVK
jgi:hypothetical protein